MARCSPSIPGTRESAPRFVHLPIDANVRIAYVYTQRNAMKVWDEGGDYQELIKRDADVASHLSAEEIDRVFDLKHYLRNVEKVFARVFR